MVLWALGAAVASNYGHAISVIAAFSLIAFGLWIAYGGWKEAREATSARVVDHAAGMGSTTGRTALILIVGSSPMVEGISAFFAASGYGAPLLAIMALVFAVATVATYVATCVGAVLGLRAASLGPFERYGELLSGTVVALVGMYALATA